MYENWYAGTVFPPPGDEPEWFEQEFGKVLLPYTNVDDVVQARRLAMKAASRPSPLPGEEGYTDVQYLPPLSLN
ncbi:hypothetical protein GE061_015576 [Apolygus lucorum]|uniref:Uncharacterized protein n=1 Tax=Apolygus lucorum TaxID=248454 RepID=A0A8S9XQG7_APOLU|nr:hypothetical protein GE061_015576 [Apolygus lucorum]